MPEVQDQMKRLVNVPSSPKRIVSLVPSQTELLYDLGLGDRVVGITKFCIHPRKWLSEKTIVGGTKQYHFDRIEGLQPDLIIGNKEENEQAGIEKLAEQYPVWMSDISTLEDAFEMITGIGQLVNKEGLSTEIVRNVRNSFNELKGYNNKTKTLYLIWKKPYMAAAKGTFIDEMMSIAGFENCILNVRYPELSEEDIKELNPHTILLSSEPYPFKDKHIEELKQIVPEAEIRLVDGELFSWYGSRLQKSATYFRSLRK